MATIDQLQIVQKAAPFRAFEIRLADGRSYRVPHPEHLAVDPRPRAHAAIFFDPKGLETHLLDIALIAEIVFATPDGESGVEKVEPQRDRQ